MLNYMREQAGYAWDNLKNLVSDAYQGVVNHLQSPFRGLMSLWRRGAQDKSKLEQIRSEQFEQIHDALKQSEADYQKITKQISAQTKQYVNQIFDEEIKALGEPPTKFCVTTLGSLAREEAGPITDLEIAILMEQDSVEARRYFNELSQRVSDRLYLLGEHPDIGGKGLRMDEADNAPPHRKFFARNASQGQLRGLINDAVKERDFDKLPFEGSRPFLVTADQFADFTDKQYPNQYLTRQQRQTKQQTLFDSAFKTEMIKRRIKPGSKQAKALKEEIGYYVEQMTRPYNTREQRIAEQAGLHLGRNNAFLYGDESVHQRFASKKEQHLQKKEANGLSRRQQIAVEGMQADIAKIYTEQKELFLEGKLGKKIDLKRELYRFVEQFVTNIGFYEQAASQNTVDIVTELTQKGKIPAALGSELQDFINFSTKMRLKQQSVLGRQGFATYIDEQAFADDKADLEKEIKGLEQAIAYQQENGLKDDVAKQNRKLTKLKSKLEHLEDMAPGKILSAEDEAALRDKYVPILKKTFEHAQKWTKEASKPKVDKADDKKQVHKGRADALGPRPTRSRPTDHTKHKPKVGDKRRRERAHRPKPMTLMFDRARQDRKAPDSKGLRVKPSKRRCARMR